MKQRTQLIALSLMLIVMAGCSPNKEKQKERMCEDGILAYNYAKDFIKQRLVSPSTSNFPGFRSVEHSYLGNCRHRLQGYVDAQNRMGGTIRMDYTITVRYSNSTYRQESLALSER